MLTEIIESYFSSSESVLLECSVPLCICCSPARTLSTLSLSPNSPTHADCNGFTVLMALQIRSLSWAFQGCLLISPRGWYLQTKSKYSFWGKKGFFYSSPALGDLEDKWLGQKDRFWSPSPWCRDYYSFWASSMLLVNGLLNVWNMEKAPSLNSSADSCASVNISCKFPSIPIY